jgi:hypothetical protein
MAASKLQKQIRNELKKSPGKAIALAGLGVVAVYFWGDLLMSKDSSGSSAPPPPDATAIAVTAAPAAAQQQTAPATPVTEWRQIAAWIEQDLHMRSADIASAQRDPFVLDVPVETPVAEAAPEEEEPEPIEELDPAELGLVLTSTAVGPHRAAALINGRAYIEGRMIKTADGQEFRLSQISPKRVVLERAGKHFELQLAEREAASSSNGLP